MNKPLCVPITSLVKTLITGPLVPFISFFIYSLKELFIKHTSLESFLSAISRLYSNAIFLVISLEIPSNGNNILFVAFPSNRGGYAIKTVPKSNDDHTARLSFPEEWAGLAGSELEEVSKIKGLRFCHTGRFIVSCNNLDTVYKVLDKLCQ